MSIFTPRRVCWDAFVDYEAPIVRITYQVSLQRWHCMAPTMRGK